MAGCHSSGDSDPPTGPQLVFVYGTLMRGMANHRQLAGLACQGTAELAGFALYDLGPFPMAIASGDPQQRLHGELYAVPPAQLQARLLELELAGQVARLPGGLFQRLVRR